MALEPAWQPNYVDLGDDRVVRFGARCIVCGAKFVTADQPIPSAALTAPPQSPQARAADVLKYHFFVDFDSAIRELAIQCTRCERTACPDCWDDDNGMCGACVETHRLPRSPQRGQLIAGPLADGRLRRLEPGQYSEASRPGWLNQLLASQPLSSTLNQLQSGVNDAEWERVLGPAVPAPQGPLHAPPVVQVSGPSHPPNADQPAARVSTATPPPAFNAPVQFSMPMPQAPAPSPTPQERQPSNMVMCPRCGTANFDFVTNCTVCLLQLIQICPTCDKLSPGDAERCLHCGAPLAQQQSWSNVQAPITRLSAQQVRDHTARAQGAKPKRRITGRRGRAEKQAEAADNAAVAFAAPAGSFPSPTHMPVQPARAAAPAAPESFPAFALPQPMTSAQPAQPAQPAPPEAPEQADVMDEAPRSLLEEIVAVVERISTIILWIVVLGVTTILIACELSPNANATMRGILHVDIRLTLAHFWEVIQRLLARTQH